MSDVAPPGGARLGPVLARPRRWKATFPRRLHERDFWLIQASVLTVTVIHIAVEALEILANHEGPAPILARLPVVLYLIPVLYAGFRYGTEGGLLTGAGAVLLAVPNLFVWHHDAFEWVGESVFMIVIIAFGVAVAVPVERQKREHARAELARDHATKLSRRLALLSDVASMLMHTADLDATLERVLHRLIEVMELRTAAVITGMDDAASINIEACHSTDAEDRDQLLEIANDLDLRGLEDGATWLAEAFAGCRFLAGGHRIGVLLISPGSTRRLSSGDLELLDAIAHHIGIAFDNARLHELDKERLHSHLLGVTRAQEEERRRISRDLHDVATHSLLLALRGLEQRTPARTTTAESIALTTVRNRIGEVIQQLRRFSRELRPSVLDHLGLAPAVEWLTTEIDARAAFTARFELQGAPVRLPPETELALYRIVEEALRNIERHAQAEHARVSLTFDDDHVRVDVEDDGVGFPRSVPADDVATAGCLGLLNMQERAQLANGHLRTDTGPGCGTTISVDAPYATAAEASRL